MTDNRTHSSGKYYGLLHRNLVFIIQAPICIMCSYYHYSIKHFFSGAYACANGADELIN